MTREIGSWQEIQTHVHRIRRESTHRPFTNSFTPPKILDNIEFFHFSKTVLYLESESNFARIYFCSSDLDELSGAIKSIPNKLNPTISYVEKTKNQNLVETFIDAGYQEIAQYSRMKKLDFSGAQVGRDECYAVDSETAQIHQLLNQHFNPITDYLPSCQDIEQLIEQKQILVERENGKVTGFVVFRVNQRTVNFNYLLNCGRPGNGTVLKHSFLRCMADRKVTSGFLWVNTSNTHAQRLYERFGWQFDGLHDWFFQHIPS